MAIDPSVPALALAGLSRPQPFDLAGEIASAQQNQVRQMAVQQAQREMQAQQRMQQLAQQYGDDPDELVRQIGHEFPDQAARLSEQINKARYAGAQAHLEQTKSAEAEIDSWQRLLQATDSQTWGAVRDAAVAKLPQLGPVLSPNYSDDAKQAALALGMSAKDWAKAQSDASQLYLDGKHDLSAARLYAAAQTPQQRAIADDLVKQAGLGKFAQMFPDAQSAQAYLTAQENAEPDKLQSPEVEAIKAWSREHGGAQPTQKDLEQIHRGFKEAGTIVRVEGTGTGATSGALTPEGIDFAATQYRLTGKMPPLGMGRTPARAQIINRAAEQSRLIGQTPVAAIQRQAAFSADSRSLGKLRSMADAAGAYENKALAQLDIVDGLSDKVSRTSIPLINRAILAGQTEIAGDANATLLLNAIMTASTEYAKIMMGGTGSAQAVTDSAMKESQKLLNASMNKTTLRKATALMRQEMGLTMQGYDAALGHIGERMGGAPQSAVPTAVDPKDPLGILKK